MEYKNALSHVALWYTMIAEICTSPWGQNTKNIAVIGGGIGGTSCAYFLRELFGSQIGIDLFEANKIGGRLSSERVHGDLFEAGGAVVHPRNRYMKEFADKFGLKSKPPSSFDSAGLYDGNEFRFIESGWQCITYTKLLWCYGLDLFRLRNYINALLDKFENVYTVQNKKQSFTTLRDLLEAIDPEIPSYLTTTIKDAFEKEKYNERLINELVYATIRVNYGQNNSIHQFVGSVSVAGAVDGLWTIDGGNKQITEKFLEFSGANFLNTKVDMIQLIEETHKYRIISEDNSYEYDVIAIATPLTNDAKLPIKFLNFPANISIPGYYQQTICTFVTGILNNTFFGFNDLKNVPSSIFAVNDTLYYSSISLLKFNGDNSVYKVFSRDILTENQLNSLFIKIQRVKIVDWLAYPHYTTVQRDDTFVLHKDLYYINAIEWAASAMEMSIIGARNVALLVYNDWKDIHVTNRVEYCLHDVYISKHAPKIKLTSLDKNRLYLIFQTKQKPNIENQCD